MKTIDAVQPPALHVAAGDLFTLPPQSHHRGIALLCAGIVATLFVGFIPFGGRTLPMHGVFFTVGPAIFAAIACCALITAYILWGQYALNGRTTIAVLALAYCLNGFFSLGQILVYPLPNGDGGFGGVQAPPLFWLVRHASFAILVLVLGLLNPFGAKANVRAPNWSAYLAILVAPAALAIAATIYVFAARLPMLQGEHYTQLYLRIAFGIWLVLLAAIALYTRRTRLRTLFNIWFSVALLAFFADITTKLIFPIRSSIGGWVGLIESLISSSVILIVLLEESGRLTQLIEATSVHDQLTGLPNRTLLAERMTQTLAQAKRSGQRFAVLALDLDHFKQINDSGGHQAGDQALRIISQRFAATLREGDTLARVGGDEFIVLQPGIETVDAAVAFANRLIATLAEPVMLGTGSYRVGVSIGIATFPTDGEDVATLLRAADRAMYVAKDEGRGRAAIAS